MLTLRMVCPSVCMSYVTLVHPAKTVGRNEMTFGRDTTVVARNIWDYLSVSAKWHLILSKIRVTTKSDVKKIGTRYLQIYNGSEVKTLH